MITISHTSGPLVGKIQRFDDSKERIEFGRDDKCDVVYPPEETSVGHQHFALVRDGSSGDWALHLYGVHFVSVDKLPAQQDQPVKSGQHFHLGPADGPNFAVTIERAVPKSSAKTEDQPEPTPLPIRIRHLAIAGSAIAAILALTISGLMVNNYINQKQVAATVASLSKDQQRAQEDLARIGREAAVSIDQSVIDRLARATFLVFQQDAQGRQFAMGTAWVIGPNLLATNAHISTQCDDLKPDDQPLVIKQLVECNSYKPGEKLYVRQPGAGGKTYEVIGHSFDSGYVAFPKFALAEDPTIASFGGGQPIALGEIDGYDVGLLRVKDDLPPGLALEVASQDELLALKAGMPIASAGYPAEGIFNSDVLPLGAVPQVRYGNISALTDFFFLPTDPAHSQLVQHSIPITGGASGSPIVSASGHVIAVVSSGNFTAGVGSLSRTPSAVQINYAQRADLVSRLLAGQAEGENALKADKDYWTKQMANFKRGIDLVGAWVLDQTKPDPKATATLVSETQANLQASDMSVDPVSEKKQRIKVEKVNLSAGTHYLIFVYAGDETNIQIYLKDSSNQTEADNTISQWYPSVSYTPPNTGTWSLVVVGPDQDTPLTTEVYSWQSSSS